ncbi:hypothetical protein ACFXGT_19295 [Streptomyces sp. NPDC059352]|uniref:hypothetical protein n=1 Tax=Streptomyces sp. NPDC059352 TaxID=3346810 RepID=UPI0036C0BB26
MGPTTRRWLRTRRAARTASVRGMVAGGAFEGEREGARVRQVLGELQSARLIRGGFHPIRDARLMYVGGETGYTGYPTLSGRAA